ncbi:Erythropoietin, partial [Galemys pyrenaicus]
TAWLCFLECPALLLLLSLLLFSLGLPVLGAPQRLICDSRVLERYILEAREAENVTMGCAEGGNFRENLTVPDTKVNFYSWKKMEIEQQAGEIWQGLALLSEAVLRGQTLLTNSSQLPETLQLHVDKAVSSLRSLTSLLRALGAQVSRTPFTLLFVLPVKWAEGTCLQILRLPSSPSNSVLSPISLPGNLVLSLWQKETLPEAASAVPLRTFTVDTLCKLFRIYSNFLRGKLKLYTGEACRRGDR